MAGFDLNLLRIFDAVWRHRNLSRAATELELTQSTLSHALGRLREQLDDPLFVRTGHGMQPSARAVQLAPVVESLLTSIRDRVLTAPEFDPQTSRRTFAIAMTDVGEIAFLPRLLHELAATAPQVSVHAVSVRPQDLVVDLASGKVDLAVGYFPDLQGADTFQQRLYTEGFVCLVRQDHPLVHGEITREQFLQMSHVIVDTEERHRGLAEEYLKSEHVARREALRLPHFMSIAPVVAATDLIVTVPEALAEVLGRLASVQVLRPPLKFPSFEVKQHWHLCQHYEPANQWLREIVWKLFNRPTSEPRPRRSRKVSA